MSMTRQATPTRKAMTAGGVGRFVLGRLELRMLALAILIAVVLSIASPYFLTVKNLLNLLDQSIVVGIVSIGMTFVILTGGIDLSVGSVAGVSGIIFGVTIPTLGLGGAAVAALLAGSTAGLISGILISEFGLASFVVTLGMMAIGRSLAYIISGAQAITNIPFALNDLEYTTILGIRANVLVLLGAYLLAWLYLSYTKGGRTIYALGSNREAARAAGLNIRFYSILPYVTSGCLAALSIIMTTGQLLSVDPLAGNLMELDSIAAVVIGGASLYGGRGSVIGTLLGVFIMVMIRNGLNLLGVSPFWQGTAIGIIIITAVLLERLLSGRRTR
ncbi:ABC transporter permease [Acidisoma cladoniae]|jgi:ribose transport system permease protein|uniref:ABC transporter permease n=1 Tax=Acidisoma cladoniae TaxID=3040935 RepID=UPI002549FC6C|nr:ABC transporter permease [Acidisoma sp. PAMC 29798]